MKDNDLDILLAEYRNQQVSDLQIQKWKQFVRTEIKQRPVINQFWMQLVAACVLGFILGVLAFKPAQSSSIDLQIAQNDKSNATIEYVLTKTD